MPNNLSDSDTLKLMTKIQENIPEKFGYILITGDSEQLVGVEQTDLTFLSNLLPDVAIDVMESVVETLQSSPNDPPPEPEIPPGAPRWAG